MMCLLASYKKKNGKNIFFASDPELDPDPEPDPYPLVRGTAPGIRIRTKMSRIPNTASNREGNGRPWPKSPFYTWNKYQLLGGGDVSHICHFLHIFTP